MSTQMRVMELEFVECVVCKAKPGSPPLCESCLNNRAVISHLRARVKHLGRFAGTATDDLYYAANCTCTKPWLENPECPVHGR